jgi:sulfur carrier protein
MKIFLNGQEQALDTGTTLTQLIATFADDPRGIAIERNLEIVPKSAWDGCVLKDGDRLEVVQFVGGG